jgi:hypothetical protein
LFGVINEGMRFLGSVKEFDEELNLKAANYKNKMLSAASSVIRTDRNSSIVNVLERVFISVVALSAVNYSQIESASIQQWETFIADNAEKILEYIGNVIPEEKTEYDSLP